MLGEFPACHVSLLEGNISKQIIRPLEVWHASGCTAARDVPVLSVGESRGEDVLLAELGTFQGDGIPVTFFRMLGNSQAKPTSRWWNFKYFLIFIPQIWEMIQLDEHVCQMGWFNHQLAFFSGSCIHFNPLHRNSAPPSFGFCKNEIWLNSAWIWYKQSGSWRCSMIWRLKFKHLLILKGAQLLKEWTYPLDQHLIQLLRSHTFFLKSAYLNSTFFEKIWYVFRRWTFTLAVLGVS